MGKLSAALLALVLAVPAAPALAQRESELIRFEWVSGFLLQGNMADASFQLDATPFGGLFVERTGGSLDVDPAVWSGLRGTYRLSDRMTLGITYLHARAQYRVQFPALASVDGNFDLEGLILASEDFINQAEVDVRASRALTDAVTDVYLASLEYEFPILNRAAIPYVSLGTGIFSQKSDGDVIQLRYDTNIPSRIETTENLGINPVGASGLSVFQIDQKSWALQIGGGMRVGVTGRWGVDLEILDVIQMNANLKDIDAASAPPADPLQGRVYSTSFQGKEGMIHNFGIRMAITYSLWPYGRPR